MLQRSRINGTRPLAVSLLLASIVATTAAGYPKVTMPAAKAGSAPNLVPVPAPRANAVALSENLGLLAFAHDKGAIDGQVSLVKLGAKGNPLPYSTTWKLPRPDALAKAGTYALGVAFHPKLPLLYVWQDVALPYNNPPPPPPPDIKLFDHLLVYDVAKEVPELVVSLCRGDEFMWGMAGGAVTVDPTGQYLYVPNLREAKNAGSLRFGRFRLDAHGLPELDAKDAALPRPARIQKIIATAAAKGGVPPDLTPIEYVNIFPLSFSGCGQSMHALSMDVVVAGTSNGMVVWRFDDKEAALHALPIKSGGHHLIGVHPKLPFLFVTIGKTDSFFRVAHADGYLSLLPLEIVLPKAYLSGAPVVIDKGTRVAIGGHHFVYFVPLDAKGQPQPEVTRVQVLNPAVRAMVYSERFDRLYVGVEVSR